MAYVRVVSLIDEHNGRELVRIIQPSKRVERLLPVRRDTYDIEKIFPKQTLNLKLGFLDLRDLRQKPQLGRCVVINRLRRVVHHVVLAKDTDETYIQGIRDIVLERINQEKDLHRVPFFAITAISPRIARVRSALNDLPIRCPRIIQGRGERDKGKRPYGLGGAWRCSHSFAYFTQVYMLAK